MVENKPNLGYVGLPPWETFMSDDPGIISRLETTAVPFSFEYNINLEEYSGFSHKAIAFEGVVKTEALTRCNARQRDTI